MKIVSFNLAKLLKEKGFDEITNLIYMTNHTTEVLFENINQLKHSDGNNPFCSAPTIEEVVMWLYENYSIWISCNHYGGLNFPNMSFYYTISGQTKDGQPIRSNVYDSPTEAYEAAILFCLEKII